MRKLLVFLLSAAILVCLICVSKAEEELHFYVKRGKDHLPPTTDERFMSAFDENCFYMDMKAGSEGEKKIYLTFDAGYENGNVSKILDVLCEENAPAAFFVLSHFIKSAPDLIQRMADEGHLVCNHTSRHKNMAHMNEEAFCQELESLEAVYKEATGKTLARFYRPPEGTFSRSNLAMAEKMGYKTVFWSLSYKDWNDDIATNKEKALEILKTNTHPGAIVLLHPTTAQNTEILREMIAFWRAEGYTISSLDTI